MLQASLDAFGFDVGVFLVVDAEVDVAEVEDTGEELRTNVASRTMIGVNELEYCSVYRTPASLDSIYQRRRIANVFGLFPARRFRTTSDYVPPS